MLVAGVAAALAGAGAGAGAITEAGVGDGVSARGGMEAEAPGTISPAGRATDGASASGMGAIMRTPGMFGASKTAPVSAGGSIVDGDNAGVVIGADAAGATADGVTVAGIVCWTRLSCVCAAEGESPLAANRTKAGIIFFDAAVGPCRELMYALLC